MACDEMREISEDRWDEDLWGTGVGSLCLPKTKLVFYFGYKDHWVADHTRDELISARARGEGSDQWKPKMIIDGEDIPHGFCIRK